MKRAAVLVLIVVATALAACSGKDAGDPAGRPGPTASTGTTTTTVDSAGVESAQLMATALEQLVTVDHTFEAGPPPFGEYLIQENLDPRAGSPARDRGESRPLTAAEREAIEQVIEPFGPVRWIDDPAEWRTEDLRPVVEGSVILGVGEPTIDGDTALLPVSLWCGGLCGTWLTYRLDRTSESWQVTGTEGPVTMA